MKKAIIYGLSTSALAAFAFFAYFAWWMDRTGRMYAPAYTYTSFSTNELINLYINECGFEVDSFVACIRESKERGLIRSSQLVDTRYALTPSVYIQDLGFLVADDLGLYDRAGLPIIVCKTPLASVRAEKGEPGGKNHLAGYANGGLRRMTPGEFRSLDQSLYVDVEVLIAELD